MEDDYYNDDYYNDDYKKVYDINARRRLQLGEPSEPVAYSLPRGGQQSVYPQLVTQKELQTVHYERVLPPSLLPPSTLPPMEQHMLRVANDGFVLNEHARRKMLIPGGESGSEISTAAAAYYQDKSQPSDFSVNSPYEECDIQQAMSGGVKPSGSAGGYGGGSNEGIVSGGGFGFRPQDTVYLQDAGNDIIAPYQDYTEYEASYTDPITGQTSHTYSLNMDRYAKGVYNEPPAHELGREHYMMRAWTGNKDYLNRVLPMKTEVPNDGVAPTADPTHGRAFAVSDRAEATMRGERETFFKRDPGVAPLQDAGHWTGYVGLREMARYYDTNTTSRKEGGGSYLLSGGPESNEHSSSSPVAPSNLQIYDTIRRDAGGLGAYRVSTPSAESGLNVSPHNYAGMMPAFTTSSQPAGPILLMKTMDSRLGLTSMGVEDGKIVDSTSQGWTSASTELHQRGGGGVPDAWIVNSEVSPIYTRMSEYEVLHQTGVSDRTPSLNEGGGWTKTDGSDHSVLYRTEQADRAPAAGEGSGWASVSTHVSVRGENAVPDSVTVYPDTKTWQRAETDAATYSPSTDSSLVTSPVTSPWIKIMSPVTVNSPDSVPSHLETSGPVSSPLKAEFQQSNQLNVSGPSRPAAYTEVVGGAGKAAAGYEVPNYDKGSWDRLPLTNNEVSGPGKASSWAEVGQGLLSVPDHVSTGGETGVGLRAGTSFEVGRAPVTNDRPEYDTSVFSTWRHVAGPEPPAQGMGTVQAGKPGVEHDTTGTLKAEANFATDLVKNVDWRESTREYWSRTQGEGGALQPRNTQLGDEVGPSATVKLRSQVYGAVQMQPPLPTVSRYNRDREAYVAIDKIKMYASDSDSD